jgi:hypothetical protein
LPRLHRRNLPRVDEAEVTNGDLPILLGFWPCQCGEPDVEGVPIERRRDDERIVEVRACRECWGDLAVNSTA